MQEFYKSRVAADQSLQTTVSVPQPLSYSILLPAKNEALSLRHLLPKLRSLYPGMDVIVVNDGSSDDTAAVCRKAGVKVLSSPYSQGNGAAIKMAARQAQTDVLIMMDADGQHRIEDVPRLLAKLNEGYDMVVGARSIAGQAGRRRTLGNYLYNKFASLITGHRIEDLTSGFRAVKAGKFREFLYLLPNGFSYPTTITMAFFRSGYSVAYVPIEINQRLGNSHLRLLKDGARFLVIIFKVGSLYSPLKVFAPASLFLFALAIAFYSYTFITEGRFTNMGALLFLTAIMTFLIGLVSEQISILLYSKSKD